MRTHRSLPLLALFVLRCGNSPIRAQPDVDAQIEARSPRPLGLNDVSILVPLPTTPSHPILAKATDQGADGGSIISPDLYQRLASNGAGELDVLAALDSFHLVAVRFDLCDRAAPGECGETDDGRLRTVWQPIDEAGAQDVALHAFHALPGRDLPEVIAQLRQLAHLQTWAPAAALQLSRELAVPNGAYGERLRALVHGFFSRDRLVRLTFFAKPTFAKFSLWLFKGLERKNAEFVQIDMPGIGPGVDFAQQVFLSDSPSSDYDLTPVLDLPTGFVRSLTSEAYAGGDGALRRQTLEALASIDNPNRHTTKDLQCASCHLSTVLQAVRGSDAVPDLESRYTSTYNLSIDQGASSQSPQFLRAFGWLERTALISRRVVHESAQVLFEIEKRFPEH